MALYADRRIRSARRRVIRQPDAYSQPTTGYTPTDAYSQPTTGYALNDAYGQTTTGYAPTDAQSADERRTDCRADVPADATPRKTTTRQTLSPMRERKARTDPSTTAISRSIREEEDEPETPAANVEYDDGTRW
ncbi:MAG: hypothetical protein ACLS7Z_05325 [Christensenellales bacterium]